MGLIVFNQLKLKNFFGGCVDKILRASITPYVRFWINSLRVHDIYNCLSTLQDNHHRGTKGGSIQGVFLIKGLNFCTQLNIFLVVCFLGFCLKDVPNFSCFQKWSCNWVNYHHKFIGFMGSFQICVKSIISWVCIV
jgi:hypothetical protein